MSFTMPPRWAFRRIESTPRPARWRGANAALRRGLWLHAPIAGAVERRVDVGEREHGGQAPVGARVEAAFAEELPRVAERAEQHVPQRQVGEIVVMDAEPMMHAMRLGPLDDVAEPLRRAYVPVLEITVERDQVTNERGRERLES